ncbi:flavodoxin domain-containing protein [Brucepastera parasyntrophica]|uniref:flavodoxin family protein n=1 Tax=Brucepastera parasyntrophica TaxID=2880008 RepID=UPI00210E9E7B|nr:flavodoxin domain-containing protein [Brucepastera parasyntrophica]ULQ60986.1 flavodoxin domain-containing protein [Brucepastera parasyntrophica]
MKMTAVYYSKTGNTKKMAEEIVSGMLTADGAEAKAMGIDDIDENWIKESKCIVVGSPIYMADISSEIKNWLENAFMKYGPMGKIGGAFATADYIHGGGELGLRTILDHMMVFGMLTYSGGGVLGKPVVHLGPVGWANHLEENLEAFRIYGQRMSKMTIELFK